MASGYGISKCGNLNPHPDHLWVRGRVPFRCVGIEPETTVQSPKDWIIAPQTMTQDEHDLVEMLGRCASLYCEKVMQPSTAYSFDPPTGHRADADEFASRIHDLQARVLANCAARCFPDKYRLQGEGHAARMARHAMHSGS